MELEPMVNTAIRVPFEDWQRLVRLAHERGLLTSKGRPNFSAAAREVLAVGLDAIQEQDQAKGGGNG